VYLIKQCFKRKKAFKCIECLNDFVKPTTIELLLTNIHLPKTNHLANAPKFPEPIPLLCVALPNIRIDKHTALYPKPSLHLSKHAHARACVVVHIVGQPALSAHSIVHCNDYPAGVGDSDEHHFCDDRDFPILCHDHVLDHGDRVLAEQQTQLISL
jgi:hypothetical protein